uniref:Putative transcriptional regulator, XRE family n=1 Tax=Cereibacter sphaeroides (strain ATCC 17025 / ATH 2.4.3) TaxID=349102 RepID=A4WQQ2_CERS5
MPRTIHTDGQAALCEAITSTRRSRGMTQAQLAQKLGCQQSLIARIESGQRRIDVLEFIAIFRALGVEPHEALQGISEKIADNHKI